MPTILLAADRSVTPGEHWTGELFGLTFNLDTIVGTLVAGVIVCGLGLYMARRAVAGRPSGLQVAFEALVDWVQGQTQELMGLRAPRGVVGLGITLFAFILTCNWLAAFPSEHYLPPPTADTNLTFALMLLVIVWVNVVGIRTHGAGRYFLQIAKKGPFEIITQFFGRPLSLALRLWGNIFAGGLMVALIGLLPATVLWLPNAAWKLFDLFIGLLQALIFALLTIIYFAEAVETHDAAGATSH
jgi:F-type H+-transporting ATPase subunit a